MSEQHRHEWHSLDDPSWLVCCRVCGEELTPARANAFERLAEAARDVVEQTAWNPYIQLLHDASYDLAALDAADGGVE